MATSAAIGPDGWIYAGELKGFPAPTGESRIWKIRPNAENVRCGKEPGTLLGRARRLHSVIDLAFGPDGKLYVAQFDDASWAAVEIFGDGIGRLGASLRPRDEALRGARERTADAHLDHVPHRREPVGDDVVARPGHGRRRPDPARRA